MSPGSMMTSMIASNGSQCSRAAWAANSFRAWHRRPASGAALTLGDEDVVVVDVGADPAGVEKLTITSSKRQPG
jgi:hypothetical protein